MQDLPPMQTRQKRERVKAYFSAVENPHTPLLEVLKGSKGSRGSSRGLGIATMPADRARANQGVGKVPRLIMASLSNTPARKWPAGNLETEVKLLIQENGKQQDLIVYTDGSVTEDQAWATASPSIVKMEVQSPSVKTVQPTRS